MSDLGFPLLVVLEGCSTGAAISTHFLLRSKLASGARGFVFDGRLLDVGAAVDLEAANRGLPQILTSFAKLLSSFRFGIDWDAWELLDEADRLTAPLLLFHGGEDDVVPVEVSDRLAAARPELVTYVRAPRRGPRAVVERRSGPMRGGGARLPPGPLRLMPIARRGPQRVPFLGHRSACSRGAGRRITHDEGVMNAGAVGNYEA